MTDDPLDDILLSMHPEELQAEAEEVAGRPAVRWTTERRPCPADLETADAVLRVLIVAAMRPDRNTRVAER